MASQRSEALWDPNRYYTFQGVFITISPFSNATATDRAAAYSVPIITSTDPSRRCAKPGSSEDGTARADHRWGVDEHHHKEETEREGSRIVYNQQRWCYWCCEWVVWRRNERNYQYERRDRYERLADNCTKIPTRKRQRNPRGDTDVDRDSCGSTRTDQFHRRCPRCDEEERRADEGEEGEEESGFEGCHRYGVVMSCFCQTFNLDFTPQSLSPILSYLHSLSLCTFAHLIRSLHSRNGLIDTCRWCERRSNSITASPLLPPPLDANKAAHNLFALSRPPARCAQ